MCIHMWHATQAIKWTIIKLFNNPKNTQWQILIYSIKEIKRMKGWSQNSNLTAFLYLSLPHSHTTYSSKIFNKHYKHINMFGPESRHVLQEIVDNIQTSVWHAFRACQYVSSVSPHRTHDNPTPRHAHAFLIVHKVASKQNMAAF